MPLRLPDSPFLYPIIDAEFSSDFAADTMKLIRAGVRILQVRAKNVSRRLLHDIVKEVELLCSEYHVRVIVNDSVDVALVTNASGVHLGQEDFPCADARNILPEKIIGISTHNEEQFEAAQKLDVDYVAIGPVYETGTKQGPNPPLGIPRIVPLLQKKIKSVVCIGGIRQHHVRSLLNAGCDGIAVISGLYFTNDVYEGACRLMEEFQEYEKI